MPCNTHDISEFETPVMDKFVPGCKKVSLGNFIDSISCSPDPATNSEFSKGDTGKQALKHICLQFLCFLS